MKAQGLELEDVDPGYTRPVNISPLVPNIDKAKVLGDQRTEVWDGLRRARVGEMQQFLETLKPLDVARFEKTGDGIRPVKKSDLPPTDTLQGMGDFNEMMEAKQEQNRREQQRKATKLATDFLQEKKRMDESDAKIEALEQRLKNYKKEQDDYWKGRKLETVKKNEKRQATIDRTKRERVEWEDETEKVKGGRLIEARETRKQMYSKEGQKDKVDAANAKRETAFAQALELEAQQLDRLETKRIATEERLEERRCEVQRELAERSAASAARFQDRQVRIAAQQQEWAENKLSSHTTFRDKCNLARTTGTVNTKERAKSLGSLNNKAYEKWRANYDRKLNEKGEFHSNLIGKHEDAHNRMHAQSLEKIKCGNDVHSFREYKKGTWGELQRMRMNEVKKQREAHTQALVFRTAENCAKQAAQYEGHMEMTRRRTTIAKELLKFSDRAREGFIKIQCEPDERKVNKMMSDLGFVMPKLPEDDEEGGGEEAAKPAF